MVAVIARGNPGHAPFFLAVGIVLAAVTLAPRDVLVVFFVGLAGEGVVTWWATTSPDMVSVGGVYGEGVLLFLVVGVVALATSSSVAQLVGDLWKRDAEARAADARADALVQQLEQSQRMDSLGRLSGGIAHDFNNLLAVMQSCAAMVDDALPPDAQARADLSDLTDAIARGAALTRQLLTFSRRDVVKLDVLDLTAVVQRMGGLLGRLLGAGITVTLEGTDVPCPVWGSVSQLEQVLMNLAINARDAMEGTGALRVRVERGDDPTLGPVTRLAVIDDGPGLSDETKARIFEPFFTTKPAGKGTGLGLATVYGITTRLGGRVELESSVGKGARFTVVLPLAAQAAVSAAVLAAPTVLLPAHELIVYVVDDEPLLRNQMARILGTAGFKVQAFESAEQLLGTASGAVPDVLVTDVNLAGLSGTALAGQLLARHPSLRVVLVSGFTADPAETAKLLSRGALFLAKPFAPASLVAAVASHGELPASARTG